MNILYSLSCLYLLIVASVSSATEVDKAKYKPIIIAVIDTGVDIDHPYLSKWIWSNPKECGLDGEGIDLATNKIDDDHNGYVDDCHGWNFAQKNNDVTDLIGHGTHISGIIIHQYIKRSSGTNLDRKVKIMPIRYFSTSTEREVNIKTTVSAIDYAVKMGATIINYSSGGGRKNLAEFEAIARAKSKGVLVVSAAGNHGRNIGLEPFYPAAYKLSNIISVAATGRSMILMEQSNYAQNIVDIAAPGDSIISTLPNNRFGEMSGTSQATAFVTGAIVSQEAMLRRMHIAHAREGLVEFLLSRIGNKRRHLFAKIRSGFHLDMDFKQKIAFKAEPFVDEVRRISRPRK